MLESVLGVRDALSTLVPYVHRKGGHAENKDEQQHEDGEGDKRAMPISEKLVEVSYLLAQIEDVFLRCSRERNPCDGSWVFLCYVVTLLGHRVEDFFPLEGLLRSISTKYSLCSPKEKFRILLRMVLQHHQLDAFLSMLAFLTTKEFDGYNRLCLGFYKYNSVLLSEVFMNLLVKVAFVARVVPFELDVTSSAPFLSETFSDDEDDKDDKEDTAAICSRKAQSIRLRRTGHANALEGVSQLELSMDPGLMKRRDRDEDVGGNVDVTSVFAAMSVEISVGEAETGSDTSPTGIQRRRSGEFLVTAGAGGGSTNLVILETLAIHLLDAVSSTSSDDRLPDGKALVKGFLHREPSLAPVSSESGRDSTSTTATSTGGGEEYGDDEQIKWVKEQIEREQFAFSIPAAISKQALFQGLMESLLHLSSPLIGDKDLFQSMQLVMDIKQAKARVRNVALLVAQAPRRTFPLLTALLRLFDRLVSDGAFSVTTGSVILCPLLFASPAQANKKTYFDTESLASLVFSSRQSDSTPYSEFLKNYAYNTAQNAWASFMVEFLLLNVTEILSICENNM